MKLVPITIEEVRNLKGFDRMEALRRYHNWLDKQRKEDRKNLK